nr:epoxide hydrolase N-terminal domain-containing protein [Kibdelosporangium phytohabitans]
MRYRLDRVRWAPEPEGGGTSYGLPVARVRELVQHWRHHYDWRVWEERFNAHPQVHDDHRRYERALPARPFAGIRRQRSRLRCRADPTATVRVSPSIITTSCPTHAGALAAHRLPRGATVRRDPGR